MQEFDYIIVGAGSSGCVLANRLSANPALRVCLIEAGPEDRNPWIHLPLGVARLFFDPVVNWRFQSAPQEGAAGRQIYVPRGKVLGGSSSINGMIYTRGHPQDYDDWAALGNPGWAYRDVLPYFRRSEHNEDFADSPYHGQGGELNVKFLDMYNPLCEVLFQAAERMQYTRTDDFCGPTHEGFARRQVTMKNGRRHSTAQAFLAPVRGRDNLHVITNATVSRVVLEGRRATGVEILRGGRSETLHARTEVVLSAGVFGSPQILMLSGIGARADLQRHGISVVHDLPGVGQNLQEHPSAAVQYHSPTTVPWGLSWRTVPWMGWQALRYVFQRKGLFANNLLHAGGFLRTDPALSRPDVQFILMPAHRDERGRMGIGHGFALIAIVLRPESRGSIALASADPRAAPQIDLGFFRSAGDVDTLVRGLRIAREMLQSDPFTPYRGAEIAPGDKVQTESDWADFARQNAVSVFHAVGTCRMGPEGPETVVAPDLRVHGVDGLRVVDASVMPTVVAGNTNAPAIMIAEKAADMMLGRPAPAPEDVPTR